MSGPADFRILCWRICNWAKEKKEGVKEKSRQKISSERFFPMTHGLMECLRDKVETAEGVRDAEKLEQHLHFQLRERENQISL